MVATIAGMNATSSKEGVIIVVRMVCAVEKIGLEMDVMVLLGDLMVINASLDQVILSI
jgi:hypothetical protein